MVKRRQFLTYGGVALSASWLLKACASSTPEASESSQSGGAETALGETFKLAIALPGVITDGGWNQLGYEGMKTAADSLGAEMSYVEQVEQADQTEALAEFARQGYNLVVGHGGQFDAAIEQVAAEFPDSFFLVVNGDVAGENYGAVRTSYNQMLYLMGVIGASMTQTKKLAYLAGLEFKSTQQQAVAMQLGAQSVDPDVVVVPSYVGDFNDIARGKEAALALISSGVDVIMHNLDNSAPAVLKTAQEEGIYALGNNVDQLELAPEAVLTSAVQDIGGALTYVAELAGNGEIEGKRYVIGLDQPELVRMGEFNEIVPAEVKQRAEAAKEKLLASEIELEECEKAGKSAVCLA